MALLIAVELSIRPKFALVSVTEITPEQNVK